MQQRDDYRRRWLTEVAGGAGYQELKVQNPAAAASVIRRDDFARILLFSANWAYELGKSVRYDLEREGVTSESVAVDLRAVLRDVPDLTPQQRGCLEDLIERLGPGGVL